MIRVYVLLPCAWATPLPSALLPLGQLTCQVLYWLGGMSLPAVRYCQPLIPLGPRPPTGPTAPAGPAVPVAPFGPVAPLRPAGPCSPLSPFGPAGPPTPTDV